MKKINKFIFEYSGNIEPRLDSLATSYEMFMNKSAEILDFGFDLVGNLCVWYLEDPQEYDEKVKAFLITTTLTHIAHKVIQYIGRIQTERAILWLFEIEPY